MSSARGPSRIVLPLFAGSALKRGAAGRRAPRAGRRRARARRRPTRSARARRSRLNAIRTNGIASSSGHERLRLVEDREGQLLAAPLAPAAPQLLVARVLALAEPAAHERGDPEVLEPGEREDQEPVLELARAEDRAQRGDQDEARRPSRRRRRSRRGCAAGAGRARRAGAQRPPSRGARAASDARSRRRPERLLDAARQLARRGDRRLRRLDDDRLADVHLGSAGVPAAGNRACRRAGPGRSARRSSARAALRRGGRRGREAASTFPAGRSRAPRRRAAARRRARSPSRRPCRARPGTRRTASIARPRSA